MKTIEIIVSPTGETRLETKGFAGAECQEASRFLEEALGQSLSDQPTSERFLTEQAQQTTQQRLG